MHSPAITTRAPASRSPAYLRRGPAILVVLAIALGAAAADADSDQTASSGQSSPHAHELGGRAAPIDRDAVIRALR